MGRLEGKVALISFAARGQGVAQARLFVAEGARVMIADADEAHGQALADELGPNARFHPLDVGDPQSWAGATAACEQAFGRMNVLVNGIGVNFTAPIEDTTVEDFQRVVRNNQLGPLLGMQAAIAPMRRCGGGVIINLISAGSIVSFANKAIYGGTKYALRGMTGVAARELGAYGIRVNAVLPGGVATELNAGDSQALADLDAEYKNEPVQRIGRPEDVARAVLFLASDEASYCSGSELTVDGGVTAATLRPPESGRRAGLGRPQPAMEQIP
jgi:3alpha(or 20beta)-hydroxysteroid dehydrogenase